MKISASILATSITQLGRIIPSINPEAVDYIHMDVMDGNYVPQISFGEAITREVKELTTIPLDVHLMVKKPEDHFQKYLDLKPAYVTFHQETTDFGVRLSDEIRKSGSKVGISLNPMTPVTSLKYILPYIDMILIMTVDPGFYGQKFILGGLDKIKEAADMVSHLPIDIEVDGGVNASNIADIRKAGANICVVGAGLFKEGDPSSNGLNLKKLAG
ncbi:ribulose-phosphate 3-epimerase [Leptospira sp. GIMC2001]|uniref:ribulose-phosphate 3-epimerase n=1 Tax=Leptospira sp. GIMC2001 TaxID=1513297 RepID=UPI00234AE620|nr:ribulose-phosphate 3-epimerase [Leptospira sp. GIMC2001]WCL47919.1 ribulose-phosphate 3-epimerase [Leptospira sp. GIMC2001]